MPQRWISAYDFVIIKKTLQRRFLHLRNSRKISALEGNATLEVSALLDCISISYMNIVLRWYMHIFPTWAFSTLLILKPGNARSL